MVKRALAAVLRVLLSAMRLLSSASGRGSIAGRSSGTSIFAGGGGESILYVYE